MNQNCKNALIISKKMIYNDGGYITENGKKILSDLMSNNITPIILSNNARNLMNQIPDQFKNKVKFIKRNIDSRNYISKIKENCLVTILGVVDEDATFAFNCKIPIFYDSTFKFNEKKVIDYGLPITALERIFKCYNSYQINLKPYFEKEFDDKFKVISLYNANEINVNYEEQNIKKIFKENIKGNINDSDEDILFILLFMLLKYFLDSSNGNLKNAYIGTFPSSRVDNINTAMSFIKEKIRTICNINPENGPEILIRKIDSNSKHLSKDNSRISNMCNSDFSSMIINPDLCDKLEGKTVFILDDYITNGFSAESAKHLLKECNVNNIVFISIGKFGRNYYSVEYELSGDVTNLGYKYDYKEGQNKKSKIEYLDNGNLLKKYLTN